MNKKVKKFLKIVITTLIAIFVALIIAVLILQYHKLHHLPDVAYFNENDVLIYEGIEYYRVGSTVTNSFPINLNILGEVEPNDFHTMWIYTRAVFAIEGIDKTEFLVVKSPKSYIIRSSNSSITMEDFEKILSEQDVSFDG